MIGVIVSRVLTLALNKMKEQKRLRDLRLGARDAVWIGIQLHNSIAIFQSFSSQVVLTFSILINITLAFAFGFAFDKTLEVAQRFQDLS